LIQRRYSDLETREEHRQRVGRILPRESDLVAQVVPAPVRRAVDGEDKGVGEAASDLGHFAPQLDYSRDAVEAASGWELPP